MGMFLNFGEKVDSYDYKVINEREARASAGIMFLLGILSLFYFIVRKDLFLAEVFSITFIIEFFIRVFINPLYAPYMSLGSMIVSNQKPEWVEAKPKKFAWALGFILGLIMAYFILYNIVTPARLLICVICLVLLFLESSFGICLGCIMYNKLNIKLRNCPGGVCDMTWMRPKRTNKLIALVLITILFSATYIVLKETRYTPEIDVAFQKSIQEDQKFIDSANEDIIQENNTNKDCNPPQWAIDMGHKDIWKEHHGCK